MKRKETSLIKKRSKNFLKYTTLAFQMLGTIILGVFIGEFVDEKFNGNGLWLAIISVVFVVIAIYLGIKDLIVKK